MCRNLEPFLSNDLPPLAGTMRCIQDMQDIEFTIQQGKLYMLQTRNGKRTAPAALQIAVDMANEGLISKSQAILSLKPDLVDQLLHPTLDPKAKKEVIAKGLPASPGAAGGKAPLLDVC